MAATALVAARMEPELREGARRLLALEGVSESQLIRRVYEYVVHLGRVPEFVKTGEFDMLLPVEGDDKLDELLFLIQNNPFNAYDFSGITDDGLREDRGVAREDKLGRGTHD